MKVLIYNPGKRVIEETATDLKNALIRALQRGEYGDSTYVVLDDNGVTVRGGIIDKLGEDELLIGAL